MTRRRIIATPGRHGSRRPRRVVQSILIGFGCILCLDAIVGERGIITMVRVRDEYRARVRALDEARATERHLTEAIRRLRQDPDALEDLARRELGFIKPGEKVFVIKGATPPAP